MKAEVAALVTKALTPTMPFLFLRGNDAQARAEGDIDILVPNRQAVLACQLLANVARQQRWFVLFFRDIGYLSQVILSRSASGGEVYSVKVDFFSGLEWYNAGTGEITNRFFRDVLAPSNTDEGRNAIAAAVNFFQKCMTVGRLSDRDMVRIAQGGALTEQLIEIAHTLELPLTESEVKTGQLTRYATWRLRAASAGSFNVLSMVKFFYRAVAAHLKFKLRIGFRSGLLISLSGLDGSGKSTQLAMLLKTYEKAGMNTPQTIHLLPRWIPLPHHIIRRKATVVNYTRPYSEAPVSSKTNATVRLSYYLLAFVIAKVALWFSVLRGNVIVMDRCFADFVSDLSRAKIPHRMLHSSILKFCAPVGCLMFIDAQPETVVRRKCELTLEKARELRSRYQETFAQLDGQIINGDDSPETVFSSILGCIDSVYYSRLCQYSSQ